MCGACWETGKPDNNGRRGQADANRPRKGAANATGVGLSIDAENEKAILEFQMSEDNTVLSIKSKQPGEKLFVLSSFAGTVFKKTDSHIGLRSSEDDLRLNFDLGQNSRIYQPYGQTIAKGVQMAETTGTIRFYMEENGKKVPFCLNVDNEAPEYVDLKIFKSKTCP